MSFDKEFYDQRGFFVLDTSLMDSDDVLEPVGDNPIQFWDYFSYIPYTDRIISMEYSSEVAFPFSVQSSTATVVLNNFDNYFSSHTNSPIHQYLIPGRPMKVLSGYVNEPLLQQFVGLTQDKPELDQAARTVRFEALDYFSEIFKLNLSTSVAMTNVRTDEALSALFQQFGIETFQYELARGRNTIPFLFIASGTSAADCIRDIMQAEGGKLWIDEQGIIRFDQRLANDNGSVFAFNESSISSISTTGDTEIVNRVTIKSNIRSIQQPQPIHTGSGELDATLSKPIAIPANSSTVYNIKLNDPLGGYSIPTRGQRVGDSWFTVVNVGGVPVTSGVSVTDSYLSVKSLSLTITNTNGSDAYMNAIEVYGEPAKVVDTLSYEAFDPDSIAQYGEHLLEIENDMFGSEENCESFAFTVIDSYSQFDSIIEMSVKGNPALQLGDVITVTTRKIAGEFKIIKISNSISSGGVSQVIKARRHNPRRWFILDESVLDGEDNLAP